MKRETLLAGLVAALGVIAVAIAAATLEDRWYPEEEGAGDPGPGGDPPQEPPPPIEPGDGVAIPYLDQIILLLFLVLALLVGIYFVKNYRKYLPALLGLVLIGGLLLFLLEYFEPLGEMPTPEEDEEGNNVSFGGDNGETVPPEGQIDWLPVTAVLALLGLMLVAAIALSVRSGGPTVEDSPEEPRTGGTSEVAADLGAAAGRAADRIEASEGYENDVYRAWAEMTELLDLPNPEVATPGDFATEAVEAGLEPSDVRDLTRLFEDVRYGDRPANASREERAVELLRRIESRYAETE